MAEPRTVDVPLFMRPPDLSWSGELQPVPLQRARVVRDHAYTTERDKVFRSDLQTLWRFAGIRTPLSGDLAVWMTFAGRDHAINGQRWRRPDLSNLIKAVEDAGNRVLWLDDRQITTIVAVLAEWGPDVTPEVALKVWRLADA